MCMNESDNTRIKELIDRLGRIIAADEWINDINPSQWTALYYLARANRFSRSPSQVADFMSATRGTVSQTLKALARKGLIEEVRSESDKRSISYSVTGEGDELLRTKQGIDNALARIDDGQKEALLSGLEALVHNLLIERDMRAFGICKACRHHRYDENGHFCTLLNEQLRSEEADQICHEYAKAS